LSQSKTDEEPKEEQERKRNPIGGVHWHQKDSVGAAVVHQIDPCYHILRPGAAAVAKKENEGAEVQKRPREVEALHCNTEVLPSLSLSVLPSFEKIRLFLAQTQDRPFRLFLSVSGFDRDYREEDQDTENVRRVHAFDLFRHNETQEIRPCFDEVQDGRAMKDGEGHAPREVDHNVYSEILREEIHEQREVNDPFHQNDRNRREQSHIVHEPTDQKPVASCQNRQTNVDRVPFFSLRHRKVVVIVGCLQAMGVGGDGRSFHVALPLLEHQVALYRDRHIGLPYRHVYQ
jgi:hypothetical protein